MTHRRTHNTQHTRALKYTRMCVCTLMPATRLHKRTDTRQQKHINQNRSAQHEEINQPPNQANPLGPGQKGKYNSHRFWKLFLLDFKVKSELI